MATTVIHIQSGQPYDINIGRPNKWGNRWGHKPSNVKGTILVATRQEALEKHREWLLTDASRVVECISECKDCRLACWCRPNAGFQGKWRCHGQTIAALCDGCEPYEVP